MGWANCASEEIAPLGKVCQNSFYNYLVQNQTSAPLLLSMTFPVNLISTLIMDQVTLL